MWAGQLNTVRLSDVYCGEAKYAFLCAPSTYPCATGRIVHSFFYHCISKHQKPYSVSAQQSHYIKRVTPTMPCRQVSLNLFVQVGTPLLFQAFLRSAEHAHQSKKRSPFCVCWLRKIAAEHAHGRGLARTSYAHMLLSI